MKKFQKVLALDKSGNVEWVWENELFCDKIEQAAAKGRNCVMMSGKERREEILRRIRNSRDPVSGAALAAEYKVSRQVIVQDIALIRAAGYDVLATNRGYLCSSPARVLRIFEVSHTDEQMQDELNTIVDFGGIVEDVFVKHEIYGELHADLGITSRNKVALFMEEIRQGNSRPLKNITAGLHFHTVTADTEQTLDLIEKELQKKGYLVSVVQK